MEILGWFMVGFLPSLAILELSYQMGKITGKKEERYPWKRSIKPLVN